MTTEITKPVRCAIYTRKSSEEGLDMEFNSLDAQREAGEHFIHSQKSKNWICLETHYDDGGFSGGNTNRPALKRLMADIKAGKIDVVVVYKIDRLSRSICDFAELCKVFEKHETSFVSVTQDINTATSSGRMMLNILVTFAQYEREIIGERIRDKVAAAKQKGLHCGGPAPLGYRSDPVTRKLLPVEADADTIRMIFHMYTELGSAIDVAAELDRRGIRTPERTSRNGVVHAPRKFTSSMIYLYLKNPIYIGKVKHHDKLYDGEHEAIVPLELWNKVQALLKNNLVHDGRQAVRLTPLRGLVYCGYCGKRMYENYSSKTSLHYRYFCCKENGVHTPNCPLKTVPIPELEKLVVSEVAKLFVSPTLIAAIQVKAEVLTVNGKRLTSEQIVEAMQNLQTTWSCMFPVEQYAIIHLLISRITVRLDEVKIEYNIDGIEQIFKEAGAMLHD